MENLNHKNVVSYNMSTCVDVGCIPVLSVIFRCIGDLYMTF